MAVDGERALYRSGTGSSAPAFDDLFTLTEAGPVLTSACRGNLAVVEAEGRRWHLAAEWTGTFPLYYAHLDRTLAFSSRLRPLAALLAAAPDTVGIAEFLRRGYTIAGRSFFAGIRRLLPGQVLTYDPACDRLTLREGSEAWNGLLDGDAVELPSASEASWERLCAAVARALSPDERTGVMMSGGWDSRTLLAAAQAGGLTGKLCGYTHGDLASRELRLVGRLAREAGIACRREPIDARVYSLEALHSGFERVENVVFPHWHRAGVLLREMGIECVTAGVYGEVLGGHYGRAMMLQGRRKIAAVGWELLGRGQAAEPADARAALAVAAALLRPKSASRPWYWSKDAWQAAVAAVAPSARDLAEPIDADTDAALARLWARGARTTDQLIESFVTEHRGTQYINAQLLSCRAEIDIALPFGDHDLLGFASRVPLATKIHNALNRRMLRRHAPRMLRLPCAATLVPAGAPLFAQEGSRLVRRLVEEAHWKLHFASRGRVDTPHLGWVNFEFLRQGRGLEEIVDDLRVDLWDRAVLQGRLREVRAGAWPRSLHPLSDELMKIYTVDLMLR